MTFLPGRASVHASRIIIAITLSLFVEFNEEAHPADWFDMVPDLWNDDSGPFGR